MMVNFKKITEGFYYNPQVTFLMETSEMNGSDYAVIFAIHHISDLINDSSEIKDDLIFLYNDSKIYLLESFVTTYAERVSFPDFQSGSFHYSANSVTISCCIHGYNSLPIPMKEIVIPKEKWKHITTYLDYKNISENSFIMIEFEDYSQEPFLVLKKDLGSHNLKTILYGAELNSFLLDPDKYDIFLSGKEKRFYVIGDGVTSPIRPTACRTLSKKEKEGMLVKISKTPKLYDLIEIIEKS
ncbi:MAG TPA: hypothetical protein VIK86_03285 [Candidatus Paceibacterota bacterium]